MKNPLRREKTPKHQPDEYRHMIAWEQSLDMPAYVVKKNLKEASDLDAPIDAVFLANPVMVDGDKPRWKRFEELESVHATEAIIEIFEKNGWGKP